MIISTKQSRPDNVPSLIINNIEIEKVDTFKYLGLHIDEHLKWDYHIKIIKNKILPIVGILYKLKKILPIAIKKQIYFSLIHSNIIYLNAIWGNTHMYLVKSIEMLQNRALKSVFDLPNIMPSITMYQTVKILNFRNMKFKNLCIFLYKLNNKLIKSNVDIKLKVIVSSSPNNYIMCINDKSIINDTEIIEIIGNYINFRENIVPCD